MSLATFLRHAGLKDSTEVPSKCLWLRRRKTQKALNPFTDEYIGPTHGNRSANIEFIKAFLPLRMST